MSPRIAEIALDDRLYETLRVLARRAMRHERRNHTLEPTALVHEVFLRLRDQGATPADSEGRFIGLAAIMIRRVLIDHARKRRAERRGGSAEGRWVERSVELSMESLDGRSRSLDLLEFDEALTRLEALDPRRAQVVQLRFFGGLSLQRAAELLGISARTAAADWALAKAWLRRELTDEQGEGVHAGRIPDDAGRDGGGRGV